MRPALRNIFLLFFVFSSLFSQEDISSYKKLAATTSNDSLRMDAYWVLGKLYRPIDHSTSKKYIDSVLQMMAEHERAGKKPLGYHGLYKGNVLTTLANIEIENENWNEAIRIHLECAKIYEKEDYPGLVATALSNVGAIFVMTKKYDDAITYLKRSASIELKNLAKYPGDIGSEQNLANTFINLGEVYSFIPNVDSSIYYYDRSLQLNAKYKDEDGQAFCYNGLAKGHRLKKEFPKALAYNGKAMEIVRRKDNIREMTQSYVNYAEIYFDMKSYAKALQYADTVERNCRENGFNENLVGVYLVKSNIYEQIGDLKNQFKYFKLSTNLRDSLNRVNNLMVTEELKTKYETARKEEAIDKLQKQNEIKELENNRLIIIVVSTAVVALLLIWLAIFLQRTIKDRKRAYIKLQEKNIEIQKQGELLSEQAKLISKYQSQMNPHFVFNALNSIQGFVINDQKQKTIDQLQLFSKLMRQTLNNSNDEEITLDAEIEYLRTYVQFEQSRFRDPLQFEVNLPEDADDILLPPMMIQPFIENCIKHAGLHTIKDASISLSISKETNLLRIAVKDNGVGFDMTNQDIFKRSHAVSMVRSRLAILFKASGSEFKPDHFEMRSKPLLEKGTEVVFYLPLNYKY